MNPGAEVRAQTRAEYDAITNRVNWSTLKHLGKSEAHYLHAVAHGTPDTAALARGRAVHLAVLEPARFAESVAVWTGGVRRGRAWEAWSEERASMEQLNEKEYALCMMLAARVRADPTASAWLREGQPEMSMLWTAGCAESVDDATGEVRDAYSIDMKGRVDWVSTMGALVDLKTTRDASPGGFARQSYQLGYHAQAALYVDGWLAATGQELPYIIIAAEAAPPHVVQVYRLPADVLAAGRAHYQELLRRLARLRERGPDVPPAGYVEGESTLVLPRWAPGSGEGEEDISGLGITTNQEEI